MSAYCVSSACSLPAYCTAEADFLRIETVFVYTTPHDKDRVES